MYQNGYGVEKDDAKAIKWYQKAVEQENEVAKSKLRNME
jgi:TPR repeat protein